MSTYSRALRAALIGLIALPLWAAPGTGASPASAQYADARTSGSADARRAASTYGLFSGSDAPSGASVNDRRRVHVGVEFSSRRAGRVSAVRFYRSMPDRGAHRVQLRTAGGKLLARGISQPRARAGWRTARLAHPVRIVPGRHYVASYLAPRGRYATTSAVLSPRRPVRHHALTAWRGLLGTPSIARMRHVRTHYWVDIAFRPTKRAAGSTPPPADAPSTPTTPPGSNAPGSAGVPDGLALTASRSVTVNTPGAVIDGLDISGTLTINASNVTVRNTRVRASAFQVVKIANSAANVRLENVTVDAMGMSGTAGTSGVVGPGTFVGVEVLGAENGFVPGSGSLITGSYVHDLDAPGAPHYDGIQIDGGVSNIRIEKSTVDLSNHGQTSAVMVDNYFGPVSNVVVDGNHLMGGGFTVYADGNFSSSDKLAGIQYINNRMGKGDYGYGLVRQADVVWSNNVDDKTGRQVFAGG